MSGDVLIELENVGVAFNAQRRMSGGHFWALEDVSLQLRRGERLGVIGRNGAGKSTLLRTLSGAETPDEGAISIDGRPVEFHRPAEANAAGIATPAASACPTASSTASGFPRRAALRMVVAQNSVASWCTTAA